MIAQNQFNEIFCSQSKNCSQLEVIANAIQFKELQSVSVFVSQTTN